MKKYEFLVGEEDYLRLDSFISEELDELSRTYAQQLIKSNMVIVNGKPKKPSYFIKEGDIIEIQVPSPKKLELNPENIPLDIVYEDDNIAVINKQQGLVVHPAPGHYEHTLVNALLYHINTLSTINGIIRPGIVHRLDKDTSGLLVIAKNDHSHRFLSQELKAHEVKRTYFALVHGNPKKDKDTIRTFIARDIKDRKKMAVHNQKGKEAITHYEVIESFTNYSLVRIDLETGRTHQIRVHMSCIGNPVVGDPVYSSINSKFKVAGQLLHAKELSFIHPVTKQKVLFKSDLPDYFNRVLEILRGEKNA